MATDATGTPTTLGIPTYNTAADKPSGKGFNAAMSTIDTLISARLSADAVTVAGTRVLANKLLVGDAQPSFRIYGDGKLEWGAGGATATDTTLSRYAAGVIQSSALRLDSSTSYVYLPGKAAAAQFILGSNVTGDTTDRFIVLADGKLQWGAGGVSALDTNLYRMAASVLASDANQFKMTAGSFRCDEGYYISIRATSTAPTFQTLGTAGDANATFLIDRAGKQQWGAGGASALDTTFSRAGANALTTSGGSLQADLKTAAVSVTTARTGGAAAALPANPVRYLAFLDENGNRVYVPAYS